MPAGTVIFRQKSGEPNELIAIIQSSTTLNLNGTYFKFIDDEIDVSTLNGRNGFTISSFGISSNYTFAAGSVSSAGDINGDGFADVLIGVPGVNQFAGASYVVFGKPNEFSAKVNLTALNGNNGFAINGINALDFLSGVSSAGDVNGDGFADILLGAGGASPNGQTNAGESYVVFGTGGFSASLNLATLNGNNGFILEGINAFDGASTVSDAGDVNGDGFADILIGARNADPNGQSSAGQTYVVFGTGNFNARVNLATLNGRNGFAINGIKLGDASGGSVSNAGDINGDGFDDIIIGARGADPNNKSGAGQSYVVFGKRGGFDASINLAALNGSNGFVINGINQYNFSGINVSSAGDVNGDGFDDLIIGTGSPYLSRDRVTATGVGESYVIFGKAIGFNASFDLFDLNGLNGFVLKGISTYNGSATAVSNAGDVNGDGFDDLILGSSTLEESYVVFGRDFTNKVNRLGTPGDDLLIGTNGNDILIGGLGNDTLRGGRAWQ